MGAIDDRDESDHGARWPNPVSSAPARFSVIDANEAKDLIEEAVERSGNEHNAEEKAERLGERRFRDRVSLMVGLFAVALAVVHMEAAGAARNSMLRGIEASDTFAYMQAKIVRETIYKTAAATSTASESDRKTWADQAQAMRAPDVAGHGIGQLQDQGAAQREAGLKAATAVEGFETGETALQTAIVLLSVAMIAGSWRMVFGAIAVAVAGVVMAGAAYAGLAMPWAG